MNSNMFYKNQKKSASILAADIGLVTLRRISACRFRPLVGKTPLEHGAKRPANAVIHPIDEMFRRSPVDNEEGETDHRESPSAEHAGSENPCKTGDDGPLRSFEAVMAVIWWRIPRELVTRLQ